MVACLVHDDGRAAGMKEIVARLGAMMQSGNLAEAGLLRYVFAERTDSGCTHVIAAWTDGAFNVYSLLPDAGKDAPGSDPANAPRPPSAQRILTADIEGVPYGVRLYDSSASPPQVLATYDAAPLHPDDLIVDSGDFTPEEAADRIAAELALPDSVTR